MLINIILAISIVSCLFLVFCLINLFYISIFLVNLRKELKIQNKFNIDFLKESWDYKYEKELNKSADILSKKDDGIL